MRTANAEILGAQALAVARQAAEMEATNPSVARQLYVEAARNWLEASQHVGTIDQKNICLREANIIYQKAQRVRVITNHENEENGKNIPATIVRNTTRSFSDIAGLDDVKAELRLKVIAPLQYPEVFERYGKKVGGGILMYGPPGCGKSLIAEATAGEADATFFHVKASDLKSKYVGETERNIAALFEAARKEEAAIIFFDEFEALGRNREEAATLDKNFVSQLLTEMDGVGNKDQKILLLAATNIPWAIDPALRREGRFGTTVYIPPPDAESRKEILSLHLKGRPVAPSVDIPFIAESTGGYSGADMKSLCEKATDRALQSFLTTGQLRPITQEDFDIALEKQKPTIASWMTTAKKHKMEVGA